MAWYWGSGNSNKNDLLQCEGRRDRDATSLAEPSQTNLSDRVLVAVINDGIPYAMGIS